MNVVLKRDASVREETNTVGWIVWSESDQNIFL